MMVPRFLPSLLAVCLLSLAGCIQQPAHQAEGLYASLRSWMQILSVNDQPPADPYQLQLEPGEYQLQVLYRTYRQDYLCHFTFVAVGGASYEIVDHSNPQPLVLYRWERANSAWAERHDPVTPSCESNSTASAGR